MFVNHCSAIIYKSNKKSVFTIQDIVKNLQEKVNEIIVLTPEFNKQFYKEFIPEKRIIHSLTEQKFNDILNKQDIDPKVKRCLVTSIGNYRVLFGVVY